MPQKRQFHSKSRRGCLQCKKNHTKCDEQLPKCGRCNRVGADCSLAAQKERWTFIASESRKVPNRPVRSDSSKVISIPSTASISLESAVLHTESTAVATHSGAILRSVQITSAERDRLRLINHYACYVSKSISDMVTPGNTTIWTDLVTNQAFEHDFLLHCILGLSSLHLALNGVVPQRQSLLSSHHYERGITLFKPHLDNITLSNYDAALTFSYVVVIYAFGINRPAEPGLSSITSIIQILRLLRGSSALVHANKEAQRYSIWHSLLNYDVILPQKLPVELEDMFSTLLRRNSLSASDNALKETYASTIRALRLNLSIALTQRSMKTIAVFAIISPSKFWTIPHLEEPLALAILANYSVVLHCLRGNIWLQGWGKAVISAIQNVLPLEWHDTIAWAVQETEDSGLKVHTLNNPSFDTTAPLSHLNKYSQ